ncbi:uncharacterized protein TRIADDRAFT_61393 [Trichoplax adhaerens]|uniref:Uncharacterized protein n=1 Tax=Trichoplax adhaerens TaxID=10228 RepID=B3SAV5_TRIAD|nr:hypothetical protein TRIADDRAFT_61393 [Trichoplax adhaerens]EDV20169.1 hypothetical protein TRIADDRAFT_61393 [Trichoplax adhaerens]|eukprot:XP_002117330.1 hypothetical protein TRIADDRAFT_61393 [Trichoplax adhaerens]
MKVFRAIALTLWWVMHLATIPSYADLLQQQSFPSLSHSKDKHHSFIPRLQVDGVETHWPLTSPTVTLSIDFYGQELIIDLRRNDRLIPENFHHTYQGNDETVRHQGLFQPFCHYHGRIRASTSHQSQIDNAAISACQGISGVFQYKNRDYGIKQLNDKIHSIYPLSDLYSKLNNPGKPLKLIDKIHTSKYNKLPIQQENNHARQRRNVLSQTLYVEMVVVNDKRSYGLFNNITAVESYTIQVINTVDLRYKAINVRVLLVGIVTWSQQDQINVTDSGTATLSQFSDYAIKTLRLTNPYDSAQLFTGIFLKNEAGIAYLSSMCYGNSVGVIENTLNIPADTIVSAHELGHNFGMDHDNSRHCSCTFQPANATSCIMAAMVSQPYAQTFSNCSVAEMKSGLSQGLGSCLWNIPTKLFTNPICGNGIRETGEECDCGSPAECTSNCCNASTCKLHASAQCATGPCCSNCTFKQRSTLCRAVSNDCDLPEYCSGNSAECPTNIYKQSSTNCGNNTGYCYKGACFTANAQCRLFWGSTGREADNLCWNILNTRGKPEGYCQRIASGQYIPCAPADIKCGKLQCDSSTNYPLIAIIGNITIISFTQGAVTSYCKSFTADIGDSTQDPGSVLDGTKCGNQKICFKQQCRSITAVLNITQCDPADCSNHGICNNKGHCHCDSGYAPPNCSNPGNGGSIDSHGNSTVATATDLVVISPSATTPNGTIRNQGIQSIYLTLLWFALFLLI